MNLSDNIIQSFVNSFMKVKLSKSIKEHSLLNKKMDVEFLNALNDYFKQSLIDGDLPQILIKDISNITNTAGALGSKDKENIGQTLLEKNILTLNYLVSKLEKSSVLFDDKREHCFLEDGSNDTKATPSSFDAKDIDSFQENIKELENSGCLPITDGQLKAMAQRISETVYAILDQKYGSTSNLKLVRTKNDHRSMEDIIMDPNPPKNIKIKLDDDSSFSIFNPSAKITKEYEIRQVLQATSGSSNQFSALNLEDQKSLKDAFEIFETNTKRADKWSPDTQRLVTGVKKLLFLYFNEDTPVYRITRDNLLEFRDLLYKIPTKLAQKSRYKDKSLSQILKLGENDDKLSEPTIQKYMIRVIQFFNYCFDSGYISKSITAKMNVKIDIDPSERAVLPYEASEARKIFEIVTSIKQSGKSPSSRIEASELYYVTMIAAYSGMRIKEITQLHKEDIALKDGIYCFNINTNDGKTTKTKNSIRFVPIHSKLIDLGLLEYVNSKKSGNIFKVSNKDFSEIFRSQIQRKFIDKDSKKTFYSFRHYFIDYLVQREVEANLIAQIVGHEKQYKILLNTYAKPINANTLKAKVEMVSYDNE
ncbi:site-specific recombinase [Campylobacter concisus]|nr:site-specific integrase [Campylobacter concisus]MBF0922958.1 site-specific integrase [Campylobacter concisus]OUT08433.1 site-specific recombinase [Campylobacter concisus]OUT17165.1 site-specific recombinase [Campylobacter concisus]QPH95384.1 site-specific integrase [Campylobacter concisus]